MARREIEIKSKKLSKSKKEISDINNAIERDRNILSSIQKDIEIKNNEIKSLENKINELNLIKKEVELIIYTARENNNAEMKKLNDEKLELVRNIVWLEKNQEKEIEKFEEYRIEQEKEIKNNIDILKKDIVVLNNQKIQIIETNNKLVIEKNKLEKDVDKLRNKLNELKIEENQYKYITGATTTICKYGAGRLERLVNNDSTSWKTIAIYDWLSTAWTQIANIDAGVVVGNIEFSVPFNDWLTIVTNSTSANLTVVYE